MGGMKGWMDGQNKRMGGWMSERIELGCHEPLTVAATAGVGFLMGLICL